MICNEFNEIQIERYINIELTFLIAAFLLVGLKWENLAVQQPNLNVDINGVQINYFLRFFITNSVLLSLGLLQYAAKHVFSLKFPTPIENFTDLLSVTNISIWITNILDKQHGYYVHGRCPGGDAEGNMNDLKIALENENHQNSRTRGLVAGK